MIQSTPPPAPSEVKTFIGQAVTELRANLFSELVNGGCILDLYQAIADMGAFPSLALAATLIRLVMGAASFAVTRLSYSLARLRKALAL